jgi:hypothetical protein
MRDRLRQAPTWILFILLIGLGLLIHVIYPTGWFLRELVVPLSDALMIAGFLGLTVDTFAKNRLLHEAAVDISKYLIGYRLPPELQDHIRWIQTVDLVRCDCELRYRLTPREHNKMAVDVEMSYVVKNFSTTAKPYTPRLSVEDVDNPTFLSLTCLRSGNGYHMADDGKGTPLDVKTLPDGRKQVEGASINIESSRESKTTETHCKIILPNNYHDVVSLFYPTIGVRVHVECPKEYEIRIDDSENAISSGNCWEFRRLYLPSQIIGIRWLPKDSIPPAASSSAMPG